MARDLRTYSSYRQMLNRCLNKKNHNYPYYGGRGIKICDRWLKSYSNFLEDMGVRPQGTTLDRIDSKLDYTPENCRWAGRSLQSYNRRNGHWLTLYYDNVNSFTDDELKNYRNIKDLNEMIEKWQQRYPLSRAEGGVRFVESRNGIAVFVLFSKTPPGDIPVGQSIGKLTSVRAVKVNKIGIVSYEWLCECGNRITSETRQVRQRITPSCGCELRKERELRGYGKGYRSRVSYNAWQSMRTKLINTKHESYRRGGGAGYTCCERWSKYENFLADMGEPENKNFALKIKDGEKVFNKENCYWQPK
ncbi:hypothetical protein AA316_002816 [Salmonella enterica subsp. enterica]|nr:hypothetical protein [Salmonella enterica subsp. enterica]HDH8613032.1 hypothetical protein [Escherichia coli]